MPNFSNLAIFFICSIFLGCAGMRTVPESQKLLANKTLNGKCYDLFTNSESGSYQMNFRGIVANLGKAVFVLADDDRTSQLCTWAGAHELYDQFCLIDCQPTWSQLEALALSRCEDLKKQNLDYSHGTCKVFAHNDEILWKKDDAKFQ